MKKILVTTLILLGSAIATPAEVIDGGRFGDVHVDRPGEVAHGYAVFFSDHGGWSPFDQAALDMIAKENVLAVGVDTDVYLAHIAPGVRPCSELVGDVEGLSQRLQRAQEKAEYHFPILVGVGIGGAVAETIFAGAPANTLEGVGVINPTPTGGPTCSDAPRKVSGFWTVGLTRAALPETRASIAARQKAGAPIEVRAVTNEDPVEQLSSLLQPPLDAANAQSLGVLPLIDLPSARPSNLMAVLISGDGGWRDIDKKIGEQLQNDGVSVVGWDSLRYFWRRKTPDQTARDLAAVIQKYQAKWGARKVALIGYSFGADILPAVYDLLPPQIKRRVTQISLLGLESRADWEIEISGWLGAAPSDAATPVAPPLQAMPPSLIQCFYGDEESSSACPALAARGVEIVRTGGSHHFDGDYAGLAQHILDGFKRRIRSAG